MIANAESHASLCVSPDCNDSTCDCCDGKEACVFEEAWEATVRGSSTQISPARSFGWSRIFRGVVAIETF